MVMLDWNKLVVYTTNTKIAITTKTVVANTLTKEIK
jgi:hypothetical protein